MKPASQIPLDLVHEPSFEMADFIVSNSNEAAHKLVKSWPNWPGTVCALVGPAACGKTHLARAWAAEANACLLTPDMAVRDLNPGQAVLAEDLDDQGRSEDDIFHLFNWVKEISASLLITSKISPNRWGVSLPDLRSRLSTVMVGEIQQPDDDLLMVLMMKLFSDRQLQVDITVINYILPRIERSFEAVYKVINRMDTLALADKRKITRALAKACLDA